MCSYGLLPQINQPTRITENSATIVDNIFTNNMNNKILFFQRKKHQPNNENNKRLCNLFRNSDQRT